MFTRLLAAALALLACAWFVLGVHQAHDLNRATQLLSGSGPVSAASASTIQGLLSSAGTLNPDRQVQVLRGALAEARDQPRRAITILSHVVTEEPMNLTAWVYLAQAGNVAIFRRALEHVAKLDPPQKPQR